MKLIENCTTAEREREIERDRLQRVIKNRAGGGRRRARGARGGSTSDEVRERERGIFRYYPHSPQPHLAI
jgi:hypothetical protein